MPCRASGFSEAKGHRRKPGEKSGAPRTSANCRATGVACSEIRILITSKFGFNDQELDVGSAIKLTAIKFAGRQ